MIMRTRLSNMKAKLKDVHFFLIFRFRGVCKNIVFFLVWYLSNKKNINQSQGRPSSIKYGDRVKK